MTIEHRNTLLRLRWKRALLQWHREQAMGEQLMRHLGIAQPETAPKERPN